MAKKETLRLKRQRIEQEDQAASGSSSSSSEDEMVANESDSSDNESMDASDVDLDDVDSEDEEDEVDEFDTVEGSGSAKKSKKYTAEAFSSAMTNILASNLPSKDKKQPILARSKGLERKIEEEKLEYKAKKLLSAERKAIRNKGRVIPDYTTFDYEKQLRKVATRGVVKLFNAINTQQKMTEVAVHQAAEKSKASTTLEKAKNVSTMSKSNFLDLLKTKPKS